MVDLSYFGDNGFVFYNCLADLYLSRGNDIDHSVDSMGWVYDWKYNCCFFGYSYMVVNLFNLISDSKVTCYGEYSISMFTNLKSIGLDNIWIVPINDSTGINFSDAVKLEDIV